MDRENVDTDAIIPKQFLKSIKRTGFGPNLFDEWRYLDHGEPGRTQQAQAQPGLRAEPAALPGRSILLARNNFGCGSSREHAPWALEQYGFRAIMAPSFADIFFNNCFKNGLLPIVLPDPDRPPVQRGRGLPRLPADHRPERQVVVKPGGELPSTSPFRKYCLLNGFDDIGLTLRHADKIKAFEAERLRRCPG
jgi:3-isopropylmalate/(R)-2-methylmalate dehydratase small subunit